MVLKINCGIQVLTPKISSACTMFYLEHVQNSASDHQHNLDLPEDLLRQILVKLPLKQIFKSKLISKRWNSLISSPGFSKSYIAINPSNSLPWTLLLRRSYEPKVRDNKTINHALSMDTLSGELTVSICDLPLPVECKPARKNSCYRYRVVSSSNGLFLCWLFDSHTYAILNPLTRQWCSDIPKQSFGCTCESCGAAFVTRVEGSGLKVVNYKVVRLHYCLSSTKWRMHIYDSDIRRWVEPDIDVRVRAPHSFSYWDARHACLNNIIHWECSPGCIVAYDPYNHIKNWCRLIRLVAATYVRSRTLFGISNGKLQYLYQSWSNFYVWVLEDYEEGKWELKHKFLYDEFYMFRGIYGDGCRPLAFHPFDSDIIIFFIEKGLPEKIISYDARKRTLLHSRSGLSRTCTSFQVFPFVLPVWPTIIG